MSDYFDLYFAGGRSHFKKANSNYGIKKILYSYHELQSPRKFKTIFPYIRWFKNNGGKVFLDSGAFSAYTLGFKINLNNYIDFVKRYKNYFDVIASLDVINSDKQSMENYLDMCRAGCDYVVPVHHGKDDIKYLKEYVNMPQVNYIAFGGFAQLRSTKLVIKNLDKLFAEIPLDDKGRPTKRIHLFGISTPALLNRYARKIKSADSSSWVSATRWGLILLKNGKFLRYNKGKNTMSEEYAEDWLFYNVISLLNIEKNINEYIERLTIKDVASSSRN